MKSYPDEGCEATRDVGDAWRDGADALADWALSRVVARRDCYGYYTPDGKQFTEFAPVSRALLVRHFRGEGTIGAHSTNPDNLCLCVSADIDAHDGVAVDVDANWKCALRLVELLAGYGLVALICDSNGKGGYHVRAWFKGPVPAAVAHWLGEKVKATLRAEGFADFEWFPKQAGLSLAQPCGNWIRLPGKHHKRDHWTRVWDPGADAWLEGADAVRRLVAMNGSPPKRLLAAYRAEAPPPDEDTAGGPGKGKGKGRSKDGPRSGGPAADEGELRSALAALNGRLVDGYDSWLGVGMALHDWDSARGLGIWDEWSRGSIRYQPGCCDDKWDSFTAGRGVTVASIFGAAKEAGWKPPPANGDGKHPTTARPVVVVTNRLHEVVAQAVESLSRDPEVFQRGTSLVRMVRNAKPPKGMRDTEGTPQVLPINVPRLLELLSRCADWKRWGGDEGGAKDLMPHSPSEKFAKMVADRCDWPGIRPLEGIIEAPTLRPDGSIIQEPGYDHDTGLYLLPNAKFPPVPENPSREDARAATGRLLAIVADFPFESDPHRYAWLASCLTVVARFVVAGPVPLFLFDANTAGSGKTKLCDVNAIVATGRPMPRSSYSRRDEETQKQLLAIALGGFPFVLFDNLQTGDSLGGPALDKALTSTSLNERLLGSSKMSGDVPFYAVLHATGNNLGLKGDALRRIIPSRLESPMERPEERDDFAIKGDLLAYVRQNRPSLVVDALTIVRAYVVAKKPARALTPMDYPAWSGVIRNAIHWASGVDPCSTRQGKIAEDDSANELAVLIGGWEVLCRVVQKSSLTAAEALQAIEASRPIDHLGLKSTMAEWSKDGKLPTVRTIGNRLKKIRGRVCGGKSLDFKVLDGNRCWLVKPASRPLPSGFSVSSDSSYNPPTEQGTGEREGEGVSKVSGESSHFEPLSHFATPADPGEEVVEWEA